jgi:hypothetical protein
MQGAEPEGLEMTIVGIASAVNAGGGRADMLSLVVLRREFRCGSTGAQESASPDSSSHYGRTALGG